VRVTQSTLASSRRSKRLYRLARRTAFAVLLIAALLLSTSPTLRAEYFVLRSGQRLSVTGYQLLGDTYRLQIAGGFAAVPAAEVTSIEPEDVFTSNPVIAPASKEHFHDLILASASRYRVDPDLITSIIAAESNFDPRAISRRNARGLMQLLPQTAAQLGVKNIFDPTENIDAGTRYLSTLLNRYHYNLALTLAAYNAGPQSVERYRSVPPYRETYSYVNKVSHSYVKSKSSPTPAPQKTKQAALNTPKEPHL
jgi:soluble lytic murein transglycosylase-like protein